MTVVRIPEGVHDEAKRVAGMRGESVGDVIAAAWAEYIENHREQFARDLEEAAKLLRDGTSEDLAAFASRDVKARARAARKAALKPATRQE